MEDAIIIIVIIIIIISFLGQVRLMAFIFKQMGRMEESDTLFL